MATLAPLTRVTVILPHILPGVMLPHGVKSKYVWESKYNLMEGGNRIDETP